MASKSHGFTGLWVLLKKEHVLLALIVVLAFVVRLKGIGSSVTDWHAFRQADTASVTREYVNNGIDLLHPRYHDYSNIASGKENPQGYRMVEFPLVNALVFQVVRTFPTWDLVVVSRLVSVLFSLGTVIAIYSIGRSWSDKHVGLAAALTFAVLPYAVFYSRVILPEPAFLFFSTAAVATFQLWLSHQRSGWYWLSVLFLALSLLMKPFGLFLGPVFAVMAFGAFGWRAVFRYELLAYVSLAVAPLLAWRNWIAQYPEGIPASDWLFNGDGIRFRPAWFRWLFFERLTKLLLGWFGVGLLLVGGIRREQSWLKYGVWWACMLVYFSVIATGNVRHDYYQVFILPILCLTVGRGFIALVDLRKQIPVLASASLLILSWGMLYVSWNTYIHPYYSTRPDWEKAGQAADRILPPDAVVIAPAFGDTAFLFQIKRHGWPIGFGIDEKIARGATHYISTSYDDEARELEKKYVTLEKTPDYILIDLTKKML